jgi:hypothetical protein
MRICTNVEGHFTLAACVCARWRLGANKPKEALGEALAGLRIQGLKPSGSEKPLCLAAVEERLVLSPQHYNGVCQCKTPMCLFQKGR